MIRRAIPDDAAALSAVIGDAYAPYRQAGLDLPPVDEGIADDIRDRMVFVAETDGRITGGVVMTATPPDAHLLNLAVDPQAGGQGLGTALLARAVTEARMAGCRIMRLTTHRDMTDTQAFYRRLGWQEDGAEGDKVFLRLAF